MSLKLSKCHIVGNHMSGALVDPAMAALETVCCGST